jgi:hypothetical protein
MLPYIKETFQREKHLHDRMRVWVGIPMVSAGQLVLYIDNSGYDITDFVLQQVEIQRSSNTPKQYHPRFQATLVGSGQQLELDQFIVNRLNQGMILVGNSSHRQYRIGSWYSMCLLGSQ